MMKLLFFTLALAIAQGVFSTCNDNNCARAVTGTRTGKMPDVTSRMEDCSSFMLVTVTPATSTVTAYATVTDTITLPGMKRALRERQVTVVPTSVPVYASACSTPGGAASAYSSACSCWGITATTTTAPTPIATTTITTTATATACPVLDTLCGTSCHNLQTDPNNCGACSNTCASGICESGECTLACPAEDCSTYTFTCSSTNPNCLCVETAEGHGACAQNNGCNGPVCSSTTECPADTVCAVNTCCGGPGVCTSSVSACGLNSPVRLLVRDYVNGSIGFLGTWVD